MRVLLARSDSRVAVLAASITAAFDQRIRTAVPISVWTTRCSATVPRPGRRIRRGTAEHQDMPGMPSMSSDEPEPSEDIAAFSPAGVTAYHLLSLAWPFISPALASPM